MSVSDPKPQPRAIAPKPKAYAFERSLGIPPAEACRRAGGKVENGQATKWEKNKRVQAWVAYYRSIGCTEEMLAAKRARIEDRLNLAFYGDIFEFSTTVERVIRVRVGVKDGEDEFEDRIVKTLLIDWDKVSASPARAIIESFKFDKDSGHLVDFQRDSALQAGAQLRDMHGFKAPNKISDPNGDPLGAGMIKSLVPVINLLGKPEGL